MADYLAVTAGRTLTPDGVAVVAKDFMRKDGNSGLPAYAGPGARAHSWVAPFYNQESKAVSAFRGVVLDALYAGADRNIVCIGDSKINGSGPNEGTAYLHAFPSILRRLLGAVDGAVTAEPGGAQWDNRWTSVGMRAPYTADQIGVIPINGNPGPFQSTFAPGFDHTGGTFWVNATAGATVTVTVDGGTGQAIVVPSGNGFHAVTPTVTGNTAHTYQLDSPNGFHLSVFEPTYDGPRLKVTRLGRGGSTPAEWAPGYRPDGTGLWDTLELMSVDALLIGVGTNGDQGAQAPADIADVYAAAALLGVPVVALAPGGLGGTGGLRPLADYYGMYTALWDAADLHDIPLIDHQSIIGDWPTATANGLLADSVHETRKGYAFEAGASKTLLT